MADVKEPEGLHREHLREEVATVRQHVVVAEGDAVVDQARVDGPLETAKRSVYAQGPIGVGSQEYRNAAVLQDFDGELFDGHQRVHAVAARNQVAQVCDLQVPRPPEQGVQRSADAVGDFVGSAPQFRDADQGNGHTAQVGHLAVVFADGRS